MTAADSLYAGFADAYVPEDRIAALISDLVASNVANGDDADGEHIGAIIARHAKPAGDSMLAAHIDDINAVFGASDVITIRSRLDAHDVLSAAFPRMAGGMAAGSPIALAATAALVQAVRAAPTMETALDMEYRFTHRWLESTDFIEGIRAAVIDKDHAPRWRHDDVAAVPAALIEGLLAPLD
jgi:enoyl-CoA hydratase/carnithine racemase